MVDIRSYANSVSITKIEVNSINLKMKYGLKIVCKLKYNLSN